MKQIAGDVELKISRLLPSGEGVGDLELKEVRVRNALPGEKVRAHILKKRKGIRYADGLLLENPASIRQKSPCDYFPRCGGCSMLHLSESAEIALKEGKLSSDLSLNDVSFEQTQRSVSANRLGYRRKARLGVKCLGGSILVGFRESYSSRVARIEHCKILTVRLSDLIVGLKRVISSCSVKEKIPQIEVAEGDSGIAIIVRHLVPLSDPDIDQWAEFSESENVAVFFQAKGYDSLVRLRSKFLSEKLSYSLEEYGVTLDFRPELFTQVNSAINLELIRTALCFFGDLQGTTILDFFSGIGNFSLPLARRGARVLGFELSEGSVEMATLNAKKNKLLTRVEFEVADLYKTAPRKHIESDGILLDPPRSGAGPYLPQWIDQSECKKLVYISCNSESFARDAKVIVDKGFESSKIGLFNMFPGTSHFETVSLFTRK